MIKHINTSGKVQYFGIKKLLTKSVQYLPKLFINHHHISTIGIGESFKYLGRFFDFDMTDNMHKSELMSLVYRGTDVCYR